MADQENTELGSALKTLARSFSLCRNQKYHLATSHVSSGTSFSVRTPYFWTAVARPVFIRQYRSGIATSCRWDPLSAYTDLIDMTSGELLATRIALQPDPRVSGLSFCCGN